jgi:hypothetical protein
MAFFSFAFIFIFSITYPSFIGLICFVCLINSATSLFMA